MFFELFLLELFTMHQVIVQKCDVENDVWLGLPMEMKHHHVTTSLDFHWP